MAQSQKQALPRKDHSPRTVRDFEASDVLIFVENAAVTEGSVRHAHKVASAFGGSVVLVQVLCKPDNGKAPVDPIEWDITKQHNLKQLRLVTKKLEAVGKPCSVELLEGQCINQIKAFMEDRQVDIAASTRPRSDTGWLSTPTAWGVLLSKSAGVLMIPEDAIIEPNARYRKILVPLDGSARAEAALPVATILARAEDAELIMCCVVHDTGPISFGTSDPEADYLHDKIRRQNDQASRAYLDRIKKRLNHNGLTISAKVSHGSDARRTLIDVMSSEKIDFVVMSTHGQSGHRDVSTGDVARFVLDNADIPVLQVRPRNGRDSNHAFGKLSSEGLRQPSGTD